MKLSYTCAKKVVAILPIVAVLLASCTDRIPGTDDLPPLSFRHEVEPGSKLSRDVATQSVQRIKAMMEEAQLITSPDWAGEYYRGDGTVNDYLTIASENGFVFETIGCVGLYDRNLGEVSFSNGVVHLSGEYSFDREGDAPLPTEYISVKWGSRKYLLATNQLGAFCEEVSNGRLRDKGINVQFFTEINSSKDTVYGIPDLSDVWETSILQQEVKAVVTRVSHAYTNARPVSVGTIVVIDKGKKHGLRRRSKMHGRQGGIGYSGFVWELRDTNSLLRIETYDNTPAPRPGLELSTILWAANET